MEVSRSRDNCGNPVGELDVAVVLAVELHRHFNDALQFRLDSLIDVSTESLHSLEPRCGVDRIEEDHDALILAISVLSELANGIDQHVSAAVRRGLVHIVGTAEWLYLAEVDRVPAFAVKPLRQALQAVINLRGVPAVPGGQKACSLLLPPAWVHAGALDLPSEKLLLGELEEPTERAHCIDGEHEARVTENGMIVVLRVLSRDERANVPKFVEIRDQHTIEATAETQKPAQRRASGRGAWPESSLPDRNGITARCKETSVLMPLGTSHHHLPSPSSKRLAVELRRRHVLSLLDVAAMRSTPTSQTRLCVPVEFAVHPDSVCR